jgi:hypothetical protein
MSDAERKIESVLKELEKQKRHNKFEEIKIKAATIAADLKGKDYTLEDYTAFSVITLMNLCTLLPHFHPYVKKILNLWVDGQVQLDERTDNGILSLEEESRTDSIDSSEIKGSN